MSKSSKRDTAIGTQFLAGSLAGIVAEVGTHPLDMLKTRLQLQRHSRKRGMQQGKLPVYRGMTKTAIGIVQEEGFRKLYSGLPPALVRQVIKAGFQMSLYRNIREFFTPEGSNIKDLPLHRRTMAAASAGMIGQLIANPCDVVKVRLQADGQRLLSGKERRYTGAMHAFRSVYQDSGMIGFYKGLIPSMQRAGVNSGAGLASYDHLKQFFLRISDGRINDNSGLHAFTSIFSALTAVSCALPFDIVKTRIMNQSLTAPLYRNSLDCFVQIVTKEGVTSLWKGFIPTYARVFPWQFLFFLSYEQISHKLLGAGL